MARHVQSRVRWWMYLCEIRPTFALIIGITLGMLIERLELYELAISYSQSPIFSSATNIATDNHISGNEMPTRTLTSSVAHVYTPFSAAIGSNGVTSPLESRITLQQNMNAIKQGDFIHIHIETFDSYGRKRNVGGDFFFTVMTDSQSRRSTAGRVIDHRNGTYSVYFYAGWQGRAFISITLVHPRESVIWIDEVYRSSDRNANWVARYESDGVTEESMCYLVRDSVWTDKCEYRNANTMGNTVYICDRPSTLPCTALRTVITEFDSLAGNVIQKLSHEQRYLFQRPFLMTPVKDNPFWIDIKAPDIRYENIQKNLPKCGADLSIPRSDGFWSSFGVWTSLTCKTRHWTVDEIRTCLKGKTLYMIGDSTLRQWHEALTITLGEKMDFDIIRQSWANEKYNTSFIFEFHAILVGTYYLDFWGQKFEGDIFDSLQRCNYVLVLSLTYHFPTWNVRSYTERLRLLREAILRLKARCPEVVIVIKSSHPRDHTILESYVHSSDWTLYDMNRLLRENLGGLGALFVDVWDMSLSHSSDNHVHVTRKVVRQQVDLFLSYICSV